MTNFDLASDYLKRATSRMKAVELLFNEANYPAFYGENDFIPGREYDKNQAEEFVNETRWLLKSVVEALA